MTFFSNTQLFLKTASLANETIRLCET